MKIELERLNKACHLRAINEEGHTLLMDGSPEVGGEDKGMRPMQILLSSLGGCSTIDIVQILKKQRQVLDDIKITIEATRQKDIVPALFEIIKIHFKLYGKLEENKVKKAIELSMEKYCSVTKILESTATIKYSFEIVSL